MSHFFKYGNMMINPAGRGYVFLFYILSITQQNPRAQFVIQKTAFDKSGGCHHRTGIKTDNIPGKNTQRQNILLAAYDFIQKHLHSAEGSLGIVIFPVYVDGGITKLEGSGVYISAPRDDAAVFRLRVVRVQAA